MNVSLYQAAAALHANNQWQEVIADNLASGSVPGYKAREISFNAVPGGTGASQSLVQPRATTGVNFQAGQLQYTGLPANVAIEGPGFFEVRLPDGTSAYTRDGEFHVSAQGQLVTKSGYAVMGEGGPVQLDPSKHDPISIGEDGKIRQGAEEKGKLQVVAFKDPKVLTPVSGAYFIIGSSEAKARPVANPQLHPGYVEGSNASPIAEMTHMITAMRMAEANQKVIQAQDDRMQKAIAGLGNLT